MKKEKNKRHLLRNSIIVVIVVVAIALTGISNYLVSYAIGRSGDGGDRNVALEVAENASDVERLIAENRIKEEEKNETFFAQAECENVSITSEDGLRLAGVYYPEPDSHNWALVIHGYRGKHEWMNSYSRNYLEHGFQVLAPDLRACGESEGDYVGMGWLDRKDILLWIDWILTQDPEAQIVLHGESMGAATVMMTSGEETPDAVKVFVEDCGYTSVWDVFASELKLRFHLPEFPLMNTASLMADIRADYNFREASALEQVKKCEKPMLFFHGTLDDFIPFEMEEILYQAKPGDNKEMIYAEGAAHCESHLVLGDDYWAAVWTFLEKYL